MRKSELPLQHLSEEQPQRNWLVPEAREQFFSLAVDMMCIASSDGYFRWINEAFTQTLGWTPDELLARPFFEFIHPDDLASTHRVVEQLTLAGEKVFQFENRYRRKDGAWRVLSWTSAPQGDLMFAIARDVTEQNQLERALEETNGRLEQLVEERTAELRAENADHRKTVGLLRASEDTFRGLLSASPDVLVITDHIGNISFASDLIEAAFGYAPNEIVGQPLSNLIPERYRNAHEDHLRHYMKYPTMRSMGAGRELYALRKDGSEFPTEISLSPVHRSFGLSVIALIRDVTSQKQAAEKLQASEARLAHAQKLEAIGHLTGGMAHDFNNLLTIILGNADLLAEEIEDQGLRNLAEMISTAAQRGAELTNSLLAFARRQSLEPRCICVNKLLVGMDGLLRRTLGEEIEVECVHAAGLWQILADPAQLESVLLNLAVNARDAMPEGGRLAIETSNASVDDTYCELYTDVTPGQYVLISVSDSGVGMNPEVAARAIEPFFTTKEVGKGTGLGLSMAYGFTKQSAGYLNIYSEVGEGTLVKIYLPRFLGAEASGELNISNEFVEPRGNETILMVEDDPLVREHVERMLQTLGYRVLTACNGSEALEILERADDVDLLFTDVVMPGGMSGRQLADRVAELRPSIPILFTSGYSENALTHQGRLDQGVQLLRKPYRRRDLAVKIRDLLKNIDQAPRAGPRQNEA